MDVKAAIAKAKDYILELFAEDGIQHVALEEVQFDDQRNIWEITIGFWRPWDSAVDSLLFRKGNRTYKLVEIEDNTGQLRAVKNRDVRV